MKKVLFILAALIIIGSPVMAFHDAGVAHCNGCHTMHNSEDGALVDSASPNGNPSLLRDATASDVCLRCHATRSGAVLADPLNHTERGAGNFSFLLEDNINDGHNGGANPIPGRAAGHNIDAPGFGLATDQVVTTSPGGFFPSSLLGCASCHDPHGNQYFRMLNNGSTVVAEGIGLGEEESNSLHTAYNSGMSAWCAGCHGLFHNSGVFRHPSGTDARATMDFTADIYNAYNGTDDQNGGVQATSYLAAVPFEDLDNTTTSTTGPVDDGGSYVSCISCHRAHATSAADAGRWDFDVTFLHEDGVESGSFQIPDPYLSVNQRSLCNKCHNKDEGDGPFVP